MEPYDETLTGQEVPERISKKSLGTVLIMDGRERIQTTVDFEAG